jgi:DNA-directed RNA polymerase subunit H (RpoH/RPB5)
MTKLEKNELNHTMVIEMYDIKNENLPKILSYS